MCRPIRRFGPKRPNGRWRSGPLWSKSLSNNDLRMCTSCYTGRRSHSIHRNAHTPPPLGPQPRGRGRRLGVSVRSGAAEIFWEGIFNQVWGHTREPDLVGQTYARRFWRACWLGRSCLQRRIPGAPGAPHVFLIGRHLVVGRGARCRYRRRPRHRCSSCWPDASRQRYRPRRRRGGPRRR